MKLVASTECDYEITKRAEETKRELLLKHALSASALDPICYQCVAFKQDAERDAHWLAAAISRDRGVSKSTSRAANCRCNAWCAGLPPEVTRAGLAARVKQGPGRSPTWPQNITNEPVHTFQDRFSKIRFNIIIVPVLLSATWPYAAAVLHATVPPVSEPHECQLNTCRVARLAQR